MLRNGWFVHRGRAIWGYAHHNGWWGGYRKEAGWWTRYRPRSNITRNWPGRVGPNRTEDLDALTDSMIRYGFPGYEHNYGLWYDRRRDAHDTERRTDAAAVPPFLEQPWARPGPAAAWDGLPKYDLTRFNEWYFDRLRTFARLCDGKGAILFHNFYMQHALLEQQAHYADFPWRPVNCIQPTGMPDQFPAANAFYDVSVADRRQLHTAYIRKCLDVLGSFTNVVHLVSEEYTGPRSFLEFWLDTIEAWQLEAGRHVTVGLGATRDVLDAVAADPRVQVLDLRYWWYEADGEPHAPPGGQEVPGRYTGGSAATTPQMIYRQVREYRDRFGDKGIVHSLAASREQTWAFLMAGGSLLICRMEYGGEEPAEYIAPVRSAIIQPTYDFIRGYLAEELPQMRPLDGIADGPTATWCLGEPGRTYLVYALRGGEIRLDLSAAAGQYRAQWFDPRTGEITDAADGIVSGGSVATFAAPDDQDWALWLARAANS